MGHAAQQQQQQQQQTSVDEAQWPLPCAVAPIQSPITSAALPASPRKKRTWTKLVQGVWEEKPVLAPTSALFGLARPPKEIPAGMRIVKVDATVDSGAEAIVAPPNVIPGKLLPSEMSQSNREYRAANGSRIRNHGQTSAEFKTQEGHMCELLFQIADVERVLLGVTPLTSCGHEVRLRKEDGEIYHPASGRSLALSRDGGVYHLAMYFLVRDSGGNSDHNGDQRDTAPLSDASGTGRLDAARTQQQQQQQLGSDCSLHRRDGAPLAGVSDEIGRTMMQQQTHQQQQQHAQQQSPPQPSLTQARPRAMQAEGFGRPGP